MKNSGTPKFEHATGSDTMFIISIFQKLKILGSGRFIFLKKEMELMTGQDFTWKWGPLMVSFVVEGVAQKYSTCNQWSTVDT